MKKAMAILLVSLMFATVSIGALVLYDDTSPAPENCKTCVWKAVIE